MIAFISSYLNAAVTPFNVLNEIISLKMPKALSCWALYNSLENRVLTDRFIFLLFI